MMEGPKLELELIRKLHEGFEVGDGVAMSVEQDLDALAESTNMSGIKCRCCAYAYLSSQQRS